MTLEGTPTIVTASGIAGLKFLDEAETVNHYAVSSSALGIQAIVVLVHEGGIQSGRIHTTNVDSCTGIRPDRRHRQANSTPRWTSSSRVTPTSLQLRDHETSAAERRAGDQRRRAGRLLTDIDLKLDRSNPTTSRRSRKPSGHARARARPRPQTPALIASTEAVAPIANAVIGSIATDITSRHQPSGQRPR